ncbi:helix-turn-helix transcriptional regulator [Aestuariicoccus sp. MJ-SS9]|uniref:ArsR/SmtB family transcription factor n=1 Tax=Aestuariicoccus sp. MJ-SS9 TaxID=3079855 RepID=UPI002909A360|nr:helix-turn-helix transcriptional regulator [Aestuariicoccus sp. MJ-SS9]MDU8910134.1 helix-turn-helix transcriptional regulator [Aestuariicoccus sp. MJ-SS9]
MKDGPDIARVAALIGDPARANILTALMGGKALTAAELATEAGITPQTASAHLARLEAGELVRICKQGRHKYVTLGSDAVAGVLEALMGLSAGSGHLRTRTGPRDADLRRARICYNHLAGDRGVQMFDSLIARGILTAEADRVALTPEGEDFAAGFGVDLDALRRNRAPLCRACLDWSERRTHLAGSLGRAFLQRMFETGWARRDPDSRVIRFTPPGDRAFAKAFPAPVA